MNPELPLWLTIVASALGGAGLTGLVTVATKVVDLRHRHDDTKRDRYVDFLSAVQNLQQALVDAVAAHNRRPFEDIPAEQMTDVQKVAIRQVYDYALQTAKATSPLFAQARHAFLTVSLFAPERVLGPANALMDAMADQYLPFQQTVTGDPQPLPMPEWPHSEFWAFAVAVRDDLGVGTPRRDQLRRLTQRLSRRVEPEPQGPGQTTPAGPPEGT